MRFKGQGNIPINRNFQNQIPAGEYDGARFQATYHHRPEALHAHEEGVPMTRDEHNRRTAGTLIAIGAAGAAIVAGAIWGSGDVFTNSQGSFGPQPSVETTYDNPTIPETGYVEQSATSIPDFSAIDQSTIVSNH